MFASQPLKNFWNSWDSRPGCFCFKTEQLVDCLFTCRDQKVLIPWIWADLLVFPPPSIWGPSAYSVALQCFDVLQACQRRNCCLILLLLHKCSMTSCSFQALFSKMFLPPLAHRCSAELVVSKEMTYSGKCKIPSTWLVSDGAIQSLLIQWTAAARVFLSVLCLIRRRAGWITIVFLLTCTSTEFFHGSPE